MGLDPLSTIIWTGLFIGLWMVGYVHITETDIIFSSEVLLFLSTGIGAYFAKKTTTDSDKDEILKKSDSEEKVNTTWRLKPRLGRMIILFSLVLIYGIILIKQILASDPLHVTFLIDEQKYETISTLFWAFLGVAAPNLVSLVRGNKE